MLSITLWNVEHACSPDNTACIHIHVHVHPVKPALHLTLPPGTHIHKEEQRGY